MLVEPCSSSRRLSIPECHATFQATCRAWRVEGRVSRSEGARTLQYGLTAWWLTDRNGTLNLEEKLIKQLNLVRKFLSRGNHVTSTNVNCWRSQPHSFIYLRITDSGKENFAGITSLPDLSGLRDTNGKCEWMHTLTLETSSTREKNSPYFNAGNFIKEQQTHQDSNLTPVAVVFLQYQGHCKKKNKTHTTYSRKTLVIRHDHSTSLTHLKLILCDKHLMMQSISVVRWHPLSDCQPSTGCAQKYSDSVFRICALN